LKIDKLFREDHTVKLTVEIDTEPFETAKKRAARKIAQQTRIPGFRPGKAPYTVVVRTVGESVVVQEAMDLLLEDVYPQIIEESEIKPYSAGSLENIISLEPPTFEFTVPLEPIVALPEYADIRIPYHLEPVSEEDIDQVLEDLRDRYAAYEPVERSAEEGDQVSLRLRAERKNPVEDQEMTLINDRQTVLTIKPETEEPATEWPFSGFSRYLVDMSAGEEKSFEYTYPEDSSLEALRGSEAIFYIKVEEVKLRKLPELDDAFAHSVGEYESLQSLRTEIQSGLTEQRKNDYDNDYHNKIIDEILAHAKIQYPPQMVEREVGFFRHQLEDRLAHQNLDITTYLKMRQISEEDLLNELKPSAEQRLQRSLVLMEVAHNEKIEVDEQAVQNQAINTFNQINQVYKPEEARRILTQDFIQNVIANITSDQLVQQTLSRLSQIAKGEVQVVTELAELDAPDKQPETEKKKPAKKRKPRKETE
jgi:trigger factor